VREAKRESNLAATGEQGNFVVVEKFVARLKWGEGQAGAEGIFGEGVTDSKEKIWRKQ